MNQLSTHRTLCKLLLQCFLILSPGLLLAQSNDCATPTAIVSGTTCVTTAGNITAATTYTAIAGACDANRKDVWYSFVAKTAYPEITVTSASGRRRSQIYSGACGSLVSYGCSGTNDDNVPTTALTVGQTYRIRVYSSDNSNFAFNICVRDFAPSNDNCAGATTITPTPTTCSSPLTGNFYASTTSATAVAPCTGPVVTDLWYTFVAPADNANISLSGIGTDIGNISLQLFSGTCGTPVSQACGTTTINTTTLTPGTTYRVRVYASTGTIPTDPTNAGFNICITYNPPSNDECAGAVTLPVNASCSATYGTMVGSSASGLGSTCGGGTTSVDVWYKFVAVATTSTVTLGNFGANFGTGVRRMQLYGGTCGTPGAALYCLNNNTMNATGLVVGNTYFVRVFSTSATAPTTAGDFSICVTTAAANIPPRYGNSYVNITKQTTGGVVETGDILEIRMAIYYNGSTQLFRPRYLDNIPTNTTIQAGSTINVITNEGVPMQTYTQAASDDAATYNPAPGAGEYNIRMNVGFGAFLGGTPAANTVGDLTGTNTSRMISTDFPRASGALLFATAFRVQVTGAPGSVITLGAGQFRYRTGSAAGPEFTLNTVPYQILISTPMSLCTNATGVNDAAEFSGTFGSGTNLNRATDLAAPIGGYTFVAASTAQAIGDGQYGIVKNMSPRNGTSDLAQKQPNCGIPSVPADPNLNCNTRMFGGFWDVLGDHTGTNNAAGNPAPAVNVNGGYMLLVNSDNIPSNVYQQSLTNLCPNTYYEFSAWVKNVCSACGVNSLGTQTYVPGVNPNLTFVLDGVDRYSTGEVSYAGGWTKKGFVFRTGPAQTSLNLAIRTNSQGGGGNDWAIDDIAVATCLPNMTYTPTLNPVVCEANAIVLNNTIGSFFDNYRYHQWQRSTDNGVTWTNLGVSRDSTPVFNSGTNSWEYLTSYTVPPANTTVADSGNLYRVIVATTSANLSNADCRVTDGVSFINLNVMDCTPVLKTDLLSFSAKLEDRFAKLNWSVSKEETAFTYAVERSTDGRNFSVIGNVPGYNNGSAINRYNFNDPQPVNGKVWYRIVMVTTDNKKKYSAIIPLKAGMADFDFGNVINPFSSSLKFDVLVTGNSSLTIELLDLSGKVVRRTKQTAYNGINTFTLDDTYGLQTAVYTLRVINKEKVIYKKVMKVN